MINHARTLLLNRDGDSRPASSFFGEEYVPASFKALDLPNQLKTVRRAAFGGNPDDAGMNYMLWQYMRLLHSTEFKRYVFALDTRVTYLHSRSLLDETFGATFSPDTGALQITGDSGLGGADSRLDGSWRVSRPSPTSISIFNYTTERGETHYDVAVQDGVTDYVPMIGDSELLIRIFTGLATVSEWEVTYRARPKIEMDIASRVAQLLNIGLASSTYLFPDRDPYRLFKELWERHAHLPYRLSGVMLALVYRMEDLRLGRD